MPELPEIATPINEDLVLPLAGADGVIRKYAVKPTRASQWMGLSALNRAIEAEVQGRPYADDEAAAIGRAQEILLGADVAAQMVADDVLFADMQRATRTARMWHLTGCDTEAAMAEWSGKAPAVTTPKGKAGAAAS